MHLINLLPVLLVVAPAAFGVTDLMIGGVLSSQEAIRIFERAIANLNVRADTRIRGVNFSAATILMDANPIQSALSVCEKLLIRPVYAVIVSHPPKWPDQPPISVSFTCGFYHIPVIGLTARDSVFSDTVSLV